MHKHPADKKFIRTHLWRAKIRTAHLMREPLCRHCAKLGKLVPAQQVDHIVPPEGDFQLQTSANNLQSLCVSCHSRKTQGRHYAPDVGLDGYPLDPNHPANRGRGYGKSP
jgi:5-methylcytosine-specific restriction enzyme A